MVLKAELGSTSGAQSHPCREKTRYFVLGEACQKGARLEQSHFPPLWGKSFLLLIGSELVSRAPPPLLKALLCF